MKFLFKNYWGSFIIIIALIGSIILFAPKSIFNDICSQYSFEILIASITAILSTIAFNFYGKFKSYFSLKKLTGYWMVLKFETESYTPLNAYVKIELGKQDILTYHNFDLNNLDTAEGKIYMKSPYPNAGKLIWNYEWLNNTATIYPSSEYSIYIDSTPFNTHVSKTIIRIMDLNGVEHVILKKPDNQKEFVKKVTELYNETAQSMSSEIPNPFFGT